MSRATTAPPRPVVTYSQGWTDRIPDELKARPQWVVWRFALRTNKSGAQKWTKEPYQVRPTGWIRGKRPRAQSNNPATWGRFLYAVEAFRKYALRKDGERLDGIGFVFSPDDDYVGVDFDRCLIDGEVAPWALDWLRRLGPTYCEISPSGNGLKAFYRGSLPEKPGGGTGRRRGGYGEDGTGEIELYDRERYFAVTGERLDD